MFRLSGFSNILTALRIRNYRVYMVGSIFSLTGFWMQRIAIGWLTWELTGSGWWLGMVAAAEFLPSVIVGPLAGAAVDRWEPMHVIRASTALRIVVSVLLFGVTAVGFVDVGWLFAINGVLGVIASFNQPARLALLPSLVHREALTVSLALDSVVFNLALFVGPAIAGALISTGGTALTFLVTAGTFCVQLAALMMITLYVRDRDRQEKAQSLFSDMIDGLRYVARHEGIAPLLFLHAAAFIGGRGVFELMPGIAGDVFAGGAETLALLTSSIGIGAVFGGLWIAQRGVAPGYTRLAVASAAALMAALGLFLATTTLWVAVPALAISGAALIVFSICTLTLVQVSVDADMRGRVVSIYGIILRGGPAIGALGMGAASEMIGMRWIVALGVAVLFAALVGTWRRHALMESTLEKSIAPPLN